jgi:molybdopterin-guanine dinucleotide biosynthesis protein
MLGREVDQVRADRGERNVIAQDVADQLKEGEDQHEHDKAGQHQKKVLRNSRTTYSSRMRGKALRDLARWGRRLQLFEEGR